MIYYTLEYREHLIEAAKRCFDDWVMGLTTGELEECLLHGTRQPDLRREYRDFEESRSFDDDVVIRREETTNMDTKAQSLSLTTLSDIGVDLGKMLGQIENRENEKAIRVARWMVEFVAGSLTGVPDESLEVLLEASKSQLDWMMSCRQIRK